MKKYYLLAIAFLFFLGACNKAEYDTEVRGEALGALQPVSPATNAELSLNAATPDETIVFEWTAAKPGVNIAPTYTVIFFDDNTSLDNPIATVASDNDGKDNKKSFTHKTLSDLLTSNGIAAGAIKNLKWAVKASNGSMDNFTEPLNITITTAKDGATSFLLLSPVNSTETISLNPNSTTDLMTFKWTQSTASAGSPAIKYTVVLTPTDPGVEPFRIPSDNEGLDTVLNLSHEALSTLLMDAGYTDLAATIQFNWNVEAQTGSFVLPAKFENSLYVNREVNMYLVGSLQNWSIENGIKMISDQRALGKVFYSYLEVKPSETLEFKIFSKLGDWGSGYGNTSEAAPNGGVQTGYNEGGNIVISEPGIYRVTIDLENEIYYVQEKQVGIVGDVPGNGWNADSPIFGKFLGDNSFMILVDGEANKNFKLHEGGGWDSGLPYQTRYYGTTSIAGRLEEPGGDIPLVNNGVNKVVFDGSNPHQLKYTVEAYEMKMRGGEEFGGWDWNNAVSMTYLGNGSWEATITVTATTEFKFCGTENWSINYGKASEADKVEFNGNTNINISAGSWKITFNEYTLSYSITSL